MLKASWPLTTTWTLSPAVTLPGVAVTTKWSTPAGLTVTVKVCVTLPDRLLAVTWKETGELIGRTGPQYHRMWPHDPELGWALDPAWWGRGIATEAGAASVDWAFGPLDFARVVSITTEPNVASRNVMAKLGFRIHDHVESEWGTLWVHVRDR